MVDMIKVIGAGTVAVKVLCKLSDDEFKIVVSGIIYSVCKTRGIDAKEMCRRICDNVITSIDEVNSDKNITS